jgi:hypothetical protein
LLTWPFDHIRVGLGNYRLRAFPKISWPANGISARARVAYEAALLFSP